MAAHLATSPDLVGGLADEVAAYIMSGPLRERLRLALVGLVSTRLELHGRAAARLDLVNRELGEDWRVEQGGPDGGPTPTKDLVAMAQTTLQELKTGEDLVLKAVKLAIDEAKTPPSTVAAGSPLDAYSGQDERLDVPATISPAERETVRNLLAALARGGAAESQMIEGDRARAVDAVVVPSPGTQESPPAVSAPDADEPF